MFPGKMDLSTHLQFDVFNQFIGKICLEKIICSAKTTFLEQ